MLPNFLIVGAQKSGTTSLHHLLELHPEVFFPADENEIHFFDLDENFDRGSAWYESFFRDHAGQAAIGECSPFYMFEAVAAARIKQMIPDVRVIAILRDPVSRAYSHYWHEVRWGFESLDFEAAIEAEGERLRNGSLLERRHYSYLSRGRYSLQLERLIATFGRERVLVLVNEELSQAPDRVLAACAAFLSIDAKAFEPESLFAIRSNRSKLPRFRRLQRVRPVLERIWPRSCGLLDRVNLVERSYPEMSEKMRARLSREFADEPRLIRELVGVDVEPWWRLGARSEDG